MGAQVLGVYSVCTDVLELYLLPRSAQGLFSVCSFLASRL